MVSVNFEAIDMEEKYYEILRHYVNPNDCATVVRHLLNLHSVSNSVCLHEPQYQSYNSATKLQTCDKCKEITN
jgi:hypothetical protein